MFKCKMYKEMDKELIEFLEEIYGHVSFTGVYIGYPLEKIRNNSGMFCFPFEKGDGWVRHKITFSSRNDISWFKRMMPTVVGMCKDGYSVSRPLSEHKDTVIKDVLCIAQNRQLVTTDLNVYKLKSADGRRWDGTTTIPPYYEYFRDKLEYVSSGIPVVYIWKDVPVFMSTVVKSHDKTDFMNTVFADADSYGVLSGIYAFLSENAHYPEYGKYYIID